MGHPGVALRDLEASRDALSRGRYQPQPTERRLSCSHRVTFLTGANRDFPNWRRQPLRARSGRSITAEKTWCAGATLGAPSSAQEIVKNHRLAYEIAAIRGEFFKLKRPVL